MFWVENIFLEEKNQPLSKIWIFQTMHCLLQMTCSLCFSSRIETNNMLSIPLPYKKNKISRAGPLFAGQVLALSSFFFFEF
jgi:hypothetical protein